MTTDLASILARIPAGRVLPIGALSQHFRVSPRAVETAITSLDETARGAVPWHRVVMDGGALGQIGPRAEHLARLRADGLAVAPAGIVQDMDRVAFRHVAALPERPELRALAIGPSLPTPPNRSRGRLGAPKSTI